MGAHSGTAAVGFVKTALRWQGILSLLQVLVGAAMYPTCKAGYILDLCASHFGDVANVKALDVGCGVGNFHDILAPEFLSLRGVDVSSASVEHPRNAEPRQNLSVQRVGLPPAQRGRAVLQQTHPALVGGQRTNQVMRPSKRCQALRELTSHLRHRAGRAGRYIGQTGRDGQEVLDSVAYLAGEEFMVLLGLLAAGDVEEDA